MLANKYFLNSILAAKDYFEAIDEKNRNKENFKGALEIFKNRDVRRRGAIEFIEAALKHMKAFGVANDLECYKVCTVTET